MKSIILAITAMVVLGACSSRTVWSQSQDRYLLTFGDWQGRGTLTTDETEQGFNAIVIGSSIRIVESGDLDQRNDHFIALDEPINIPKPWATVGAALRTFHLEPGPELEIQGSGSATMGSTQYTWSGDPLALSRIDAPWGQVLFSDHRIVFLDGQGYLAPHHAAITDSQGQQISIKWLRYNPLPKGKGGAPARSE